MLAPSKMVELIWVESCVIALFYTSWTRGIHFWYFCRDWSQGQCIKSRSMSLLALKCWNVLISIHHNKQIIYGSNLCLWSRIVFGESAASWGMATMGACVARIQDSFFHSPTILPADWLQDVGGNMWIYLERARLNPTGRHWVDSLITPILISHQLFCTDREGDWLLQQLCT